MGTAMSRPAGPRDRRRTRSCWSRPAWSARSSPGWARTGSRLREVCRRLQKQGIPTATGQSVVESLDASGASCEPGLPGPGGLRQDPPRAPASPSAAVSRGSRAQPRQHCSVYPVPAAEQIAIPVPALVEPELWAAVQEQLDRESPASRPAVAGTVSAGRPAGLRDLWVRLLRQTAHRGAGGAPRAYAYYRCLGNDAVTAGDNGCVGTGRYGPIGWKQAVWRDVCSLLREPERIAREYERRLTQAPGTTDLPVAPGGDPEGQAGPGPVDRRLPGRGCWIAPSSNPGCVAPRNNCKPSTTRSPPSAAEQSRRQDLQLVVGHVETFAKARGQPGTGGLGDPTAGHYHLGQTD